MSDEPEVINAWLVPKHDLVLFCISLVLTGGATALLIIACFLESKFLVLIALAALVLLYIMIRDRCGSWQEGEFELVRDEDSSEE